jgi:hypothetical protein
LRPTRSYWHILLGQTDDINDMVHTLTDIILNAATECIPNKTVKIRPKDKPGYTQQIDKMFKDCHRLHRKFKRTRNLLHRQQYEDKRREAKKAFRNSKYHYYQNLTNKILNPETTTKSFWKLVKLTYGNKQCSGIPPLIENDTVITNDKDKAILLNEYFADQTVLPASDVLLPPFSYLTDARLSQITILPQTVKNILLNLNINKSNGPDNISYRLLKSCASTLCDPLAYIFNKSLLLGIYPTNWKEAIVSALHKKDHKQLKSNYRPIALLTCMSKVFERCVFNELYSYLQDNNLLNTKNSGFKKQDSALNRLLVLSDEIYNGLDNYQDILITFLDISKAFDRVWHPGLLFKLRQLGVEGGLLNWFGSYLSDRKQRVVIRGQSSPLLSLNAGVPQGSILGPLLFLVFINDIDTDLISVTHLFADDTTLLNFVNDPKVSVELLNNDLIKLTNWAKQWRVTFNASKTYYMIISLKQNRQDYPPIYLDGTKLQEVSSYTNLGLTFSKNMSWKPHIDRITNKAAKRIAILKRNQFKLPRIALEKIYLTMIRPVLEYADVLYHNCTFTQSEYLESFQRKAAIICTGAYRHTSHKLLLEELSWDPLDIRRENHKLIMFYKLKNNLAPNYITKHIPLPLSATNHYSLRNITNLKPPYARLTMSRNSFFPSTTRLWNNLPSKSKTALTTIAFKKSLKTPYSNTKNSYFTKCYGQIGNLITRLRLGLSALNSHRFKYNFIESPYCNHCHIIIETTHHYLFTCPAYTIPRARFMDDLRGLGFDTTNNKKLLEIIIYGKIPPDKHTKIVEITSRYLEDSKRFSRL